MEFMVNPTFTIVQWGSTCSRESKVFGRVNMIRLRQVFSGGDSKSKSKFIRSRISLI